MKELQSRIDAQSSTTDQDKHVSSLAQNTMLSDAGIGFTGEMAMETERLQAECNYIVSMIIKERKNENITVQDATNVWLFKKLAEFEIRIRKVERNTNNVVFGIR